MDHLDRNIEWRIIPQPVVLLVDGGWEVSGVFYPHPVHPGLKRFNADATFVIGRDARFKPSEELCHGSYDNIDESFVELREDGYYWVIVLHPEIET